MNRMKKVYVFLADGFEEIEGLTAVDILRRADMDVVMVSVMGREVVEGAHGIKVTADGLYDAVEAATDNFADADMLVLPGGGKGTEILYSTGELCKRVCAAAEAGTWLAAICAAPSVFGRLGLLEGKKATCYPGFGDRMPGCAVQDASVVQDGNFITARGMGASIEFALKLVEVLDTKEHADRIGAAIQDERYL